MTFELKDGETVLTGFLEDRSALFGVLAQIEALDLELVEVREVKSPDSRTPGASDDVADPAYAASMNLTTFLGSKPIKRMGYGAMQLAGPGVFGPPRDPSAARAVLRRAVELGVDHIDTSQYYGPDVVNDLIREALHPYPENLKLVSKVGARRDRAGGWHPALRPHELRQGVEANLRSLRIDRLDLVNLRLVGARDRTGTLLEEQLGALEDLRREGKLDLIGLSNVDQGQVRRALELVDVAEIQNLYSIIDRRDDELIAFAGERGIAFVPFFPLAGGPAQFAAQTSIAQVADKHAATPAQIALAWLLARYERMLLIPGTSSIAHLEENMSAAEIELDDADLATLSHVAAPGSRP
jgi:aryl-alcohol dehydrogenase-like predicted oxidoreductase